MNIYIGDIYLSEKEQLIFCIENIERKQLLLKVISKENESSRWVKKIDFTHAITDFNLIEVEDLEKAKWMFKCLL